MAVIEALMQLFIKEQVSVERVLNTVKRFSAPVSTSEAPTDPDSALLLWTKRCCESLKLRIEDELKSNGDEVRYFWKKSYIQASFCHFGYLFGSCCPFLALLLQTKRCCEYLKLRIEDELKNNEVNVFFCLYLFLIMYVNETLVGKGQLFSKFLFGIFNSPKNEQKFDFTTLKYLINEYTRLTIQCLAPSSCQS